MKKNFFKKLSFVLALAMIISVIAPAAGAFAAEATKLNTTSKVLTLGVDGKNAYDFNVINKASGVSYTFSSSKASVVTVGKTSGVATAVKSGYAVITAKGVKAGKTVKKLTAKVWVRSNIKSLTITGTPAADTIAIGASNDFNRTYVTDNGDTTGTTSKTVWSVSGATVSGVSIDAKGVFTSAVAGTYTILATAQVSATNKTVLATASYTVTVANSMTAAQTTLKKVAVTFASPITDAAKTGLKLYAVVGTTEVAVTTVKSISLDAAKKVATVEFNTNLAEGTTYVVKFTDVASAKFTSATVKPENVVSIKLNTTEAVVSVTKTLEVALLDANGVDISNPTLQSRLTAKSSNAGTALASNYMDLTMFKKGDVTTMEYIYHTYKYDTTGTETGNLTTSGNVVCVDAASTVVNGIAAWTIKDTTTTSPSFKAADLVQKISSSDVTGNVAKKKLFVQLNTTTGTNAATVDNTNTSVNLSKFKFESSDSTVLYIDNAGLLYPVKAGTVSIVVKYNDKAYEAIALTVAGDRTATVMELSKTEVVLSNSQAVNDTATVKVKIKDQLGDDMTTAGLTVTQLSGPSSTLPLIGSATGSSAVFFQGNPGAVTAVAGTYNYQIKANNNLTRNIVVTLSSAPASAVPTTFALELGATEVDSKFVDATAQADRVIRPTLSIGFFGLSNGVKTQNYALSGAGFVIKVTDPENNITVMSNGTFQLTTVSATGTTPVVAPIKNGTYLVQAWSGSTVMDQKSFLVKNTQLLPVFAEEKNNLVYNTGSTIDPIVQAACKVTLDNNEVFGFTAGDYLGSIGSGKTLFIKNVKYKVTLTDADGSVYDYIYTVVVNRNLQPNN